MERKEGEKMSEQVVDNVVDIVEEPIVEEPVVEEPKVEEELKPVEPVKDDNIIEIIE